MSDATLPPGGQAASAAPLPAGERETRRQRLLTLFAAKDFAALGREAAAAVALFPDQAFFWKALGVARGLLGESGEAVIGPLSEAARLLPGDAEIFDGLAQALARAGRPAEALRAGQQAVALAPRHAVLQTNYGNLLADNLRYREAIEHHRLAVSLDPRLAVGWLNLGTAWRAIPWRHGDAIAALSQAIALDPYSQVAWDNLLYLRQYQSEPLPRDTLRESLVAAELLTRSVPPRPRPAARPLAGRPLRVGWVSADFREHPVGSAVLAVLPHLAALQIEVFAYSNSTLKDPVTEKIAALATGWRTVSALSDEALVELIEADRIDLLVDLSGRTRGHRLGVFARRAAPVQVCWLGWFATSGLPQIDWYLGDRITLPENEAAHFVERRWAIDGPYYVQSPRQLEVALAPSGHQGAIRFGCFNNLAKLSTRTLDLWSRLLAAVPEATLFLKSRELGDPDIAAGLRQELVRRGVAGERLRLAGGSPLADYLAAFNEIDLSLDPTPYTGGATTFDSLWMGVPVLTLAGDRYIAHQGETLLGRAGLADWVADDEAAYLARAVRAAGATAELRRGRPALRAKFLASPLVDGRALAVQLAEAWKGMHQCALAGLPAAALPDDPVARDKTLAIRRLLEAASGDGPPMNGDPPAALQLAARRAQ